MNPKQVEIKEKSRERKQDALSSLNPSFSMWVF